MPPPARAQFPGALYNPAMKLAPIVRSVLAASAALAALTGAAGCGPGRTTAATQPTPAAFDPAQSSPEALAAVDAMATAIGSAEAWDGVKQLSFEAKYVLDGEVKGWYRHHWDRWNGRHHYETADIPAGKRDDGSFAWAAVFYDLFDAGAKPHGSYDGKAVLRDSADKFRTEARARLAEDAYMLAMIHKLRDPGVMLALDGEVARQDDGLCDPSCTTVKVTFDPAVGKDIWFVNINTRTNVPETLEKQKGTGRIGFKILEWTEAGGLKFPARLQNIGLPGEIFEFAAVEVAEPDDRLYVPSVE